MARALRIAWFTPIVEKSTEGQLFSKSEYASSILLPLLKDKCEIELFSARAGQELGDFKSRHFLTAWSRHQEKPFDLFFYNLENGIHSYFSRLHLALVPGITWFHDFTLLDDGPEPILNSPWTEMVKAFHSKNEDIIVWPNKRDQFLPKRPQAFRESAMSFYSLFSAERDLEQFRHLNPNRLNPGDRGTYLPIPIDNRNIFFDSSFQSGAKLRVATVSRPHVDFHIHSLLAALSEQRGSTELIWLIDSSERQKCLELLAEFGLDNATLVEGRSVSKWCSILENTDIAAHFLYSFFEHSNPWLSASLAQGVFCTVLDFTESEFLPTDSAIRIFPGASEISQIKIVFKTILDSKIGRNSRAYEFAAERFDAVAVANELMTTLALISSSISELSSQWERLSKAGRNELLSQNVLSEEQENAHEIKKVFSELGWL